MQNENPQLNSSPKIAKKSDHFHFEGFRSPTTTAIPDEFFDLLAPRLSEAELRVILYIMRRTFGFKKHADAISLSQLTDGIRCRDGRILDEGTGLSKPAVLKGIAGLVDKGIINVEKSANPDGRNQINIYSLRFANTFISQSNLDSQISYSNTEYSSKKSDFLKQISVYSPTPDNSNHLVNQNDYPSDRVNLVNPSSNSNLLPFNHPNNLSNPTLLPTQTTLTSSNSALPSSVNQNDKGSKPNQSKAVNQLNPQQTQITKKSETPTNGVMGNLVLANPPENQFSDDIINHLSKLGLQTKIIQQLLAKHTPSYIALKLDLIEQHGLHGIKNPPGFVYWAIENNFVPPVPAAQNKTITPQFTTVQTYLDQNQANLPTRQPVPSYAVGRKPRVAKHPAAPLPILSTKLGKPNPIPPQGEVRLAPTNGTGAAGSGQSTYPSLDYNLLWADLCQIIAGRLGEVNLAELLSSMCLISIEKIEKYEKEGGKLIVTVKPEQTWQTRLLTTNAITLVEMALRQQLGQICQLRFSPLEPAC